MKKILGMVMIIIGGIFAILTLLATVTGLPKLLGNPEHLLLRCIGYFGGSTFFLSIAAVLVVYGVKISRLSEK